MDADDVKSQLISLAWHYLFERRCRNGAVGFDPARYENAGAYCRWKIRAKMGKVISRAKGENQHTRRGPGSPEYLSKTGELPERAGDDSVEALAERAIELKKLETICETVREFAVVRALAQGLGDDRRVVAFLLEAGQARSAEDARAVVDEVATKLAKKRARPVTKRAA